MRFVCSHCNKVLKASPQHAGKRAKCPKCHQPVTVPSEQQAAESIRRREEARSADQPADDPFAAFAVYDLEDTELVYERSGRTDEVPIDFSRVAVPRAVLYMQGILLALTALIGFTLGVLVGLNAGGQSDTGAETAGPCLITGRVAFRQGPHPREPDSGAVVIIVPQDARPEQQVEPYGLRPEDEMPDEDHEGLWTIRQIGGDYARADAEGNFQLHVRSARSYYLLYISKNARRPRGQPLAKSDLAQIGNYFLPVQDLIGDNQYQWEPIASIRGSQKRLPEVVFQ